MDITEVRVSVMRGNETRSKLRAHASIALDDGFVIHDLKVLDGDEGLFVVMPSRKLSDICPECFNATPLRDYFCGNCGHELDEPEKRCRKDIRGRNKFFADIVHPLNNVVRDHVNRVVLDKYHEVKTCTEKEQVNG